MNHDPGSGSWYRDTSLETLERLRDENARLTQANSTLRREAIAADMSRRALAEQLDHAGVEVRRLNRELESQAERAVRAEKRFARFIEATKRLLTNAEGAQGEKPKPSSTEDRWDIDT